MIRRRHVIFAMGYDPKGVASYHRLMRSQLKRFQAIWPVKAEAGELKDASERIAHWTVDTTGPNWSVSTRYDFMRLDDIIKANLSMPLTRHVLRALRWWGNDIVTGTTWRLWRASGRFAAHLAYAKGLFLLWLLLAAGAGALVAWLLTAFAGVTPWITVPAGVVVAPLAFRLMQPVANRLYVHSLTNGWPFLREFGRGEPTAFDQPIADCVERLLAAASAAEVDEIIVVGHSGGGAFAPLIVARALEKDPDLGRHGPRIVLLTIGSVMPGIALHPAAKPMREVVRRLAVEPSIFWVDGQTRRDPISFRDFDSVTRLGLKLDKPRHNPLIWNVRFRDMVSPAHYDRMRWNMFRMHFQFVMANDMRATYDYLMFVCGPAPFKDWALHGAETLASFDADARYTPQRDSVAV